MIRVGRPSRRIVVPTTDGSPAKSALPELVAEDEHGFATGVFPFTGLDRPTHQRTDPQSLEEVPRNSVVDELRRLAAGRQPGDACIEAEDVREDAGFGSIVVQRGVRETVAEACLVPGRLCGDDDDPVGWGLATVAKYPFSRLKMPVFAPIPIASVSTALIENAGARRICRRAKRMSCHTPPSISKSAL